ncbi:MAG: amino acid-binding protein [Halobacteriales archaeon]|nr:amino acid-binding protein [Halobacteriales archaeon]
MSEDVADTRAYTVRLELVDEPGELLRALQPISEHGGNLLSIFHERGNLTPRGHIPVEVDLECPPHRFDPIVEALRDAGVNVIQAGADHYREELMVLLVGDLIDTDLSDTLSGIEASSSATVVDVALTAPEGMDGESSALLRLATAPGHDDDAIEAVRSVVARKGITVVEPVEVTAG